MRSRSNSPSYSLVSESLVNINSTFRISISLQRYFKDVRSRCYILVDRNRPVRWLEKRIQNIFTLPGKFCLTTNGHMLPSCEALALLNPDDTIEVVPFLTDWSTDVIINGNSTDHDMYRGNNATGSSNVDSIRERCKRKDVFNKFKNKSAVVEKATSENDQNISQIINEDQIDATTHTMDQPNCLTLVDSQGTNEACRNMNVYDDTAQTLLNMKRKALAMLDNKISADKNDKRSEDSFLDPPKRSRNRVRRRRRRVNEPSPDITEQETEVNMSDIESDKVQTENNYVPELLQDSQTALSPATGIESNVISLTHIPEVTRNETVCPRRPRVVYSLDN